MANEEVHSQQWIDRIEELVHRAEGAGDAESRRITVELLRAVLEFHAAGLERIIEIAAASGAAGEAILKRIGDDDLTSSVLLLHGLHPDDLETRVNRAVAKLEEMFGSRGASISLVSMEDGVVRLRFESGRAWAGAKVTIEKAIYQAAPEITSVIVEGFKEPVPVDFVPVSTLLSDSRL